MSLGEVLRGMVIFFYFYFFDIAIGCQIQDTVPSYVTDSC